MKVVSIFLIIAAISFSVAAQDNRSITGVVRNQQGVVSGGTVELKGRDDSTFVRTVRTSADGAFSFDVPPGRYFIRATGSPIERPLLSEVREIDVRATNGSSITLTLNLPAFIDESVTISADASQPIEQVSKTVNVITGQEMRDRADFTLVDTLRTIPGFRVQQLGGFGRTATIKTRGLRNQDTAILIDGVRFRDAASITGDATPFLSDFTLTSVNRIEVLRGSGSSLYGTNAIGGTVDFQTPRPAEGVHGQISGAAGGLGLGRFRGNLSYGAPDNQFGISGAISRTAYTKGIDGEDNASNTNFQTRLEYNPFSNTNISARFFVSDGRVRLNSSPSRIGPFLPDNSVIIDADPGVTFAPDANDPDDIQSSKFFNGQVLLTHTFSPELTFQAYYSGLKTSRENVTGPLGAGFQFTSLNTFSGLINTANANLQWSPNSSNRLTAGYEFENEKFVNDSTSEFGGDLSTRARQSSNTFYVQHLIGLMDQRLQIAGGFRAQIFSLDDPTFTSVSPLENIVLESPPAAYTFDGSVSYLFPSTGTKLRVHAGNGYRAPSLFERFASFFGAESFQQLFLAGAPDLKPERSAAFDAGIEQNLFHDRALLTATYFYTHLFEAIGYGFFPEPDRFGRINAETFGGYLNTGGLIARGAEFSARVNPHPSTDIFASYTYTNSDQRTPQVAGSGVVTSLGIPAHQFTAVVTQRIKRFWASLDFVGTSSYLAPLSFSYVYRFAGNRRVDLTGGYTFRLRRDKMNLRLFATVENLAGHEYFENGFRTVDRNGRVGLSFSF